MDICCYSDNGIGTLDGMSECTSLCESFHIKISMNDICTYNNTTFDIHSNRANFELKSLRELE